MRLSSLLARLELVSGGATGRRSTRRCLNNGARQHTNSQNRLCSSCRQQRQLCERGPTAAGGFDTGGLVRVPNSAQGLAEVCRTVSVRREHRIASSYAVFAPHSPHTRIIYRHPFGIKGPQVHQSRVQSAARISASLISAAQGGMAFADCRVSLVLSCASGLDRADAAHAGVEGSSHARRRLHLHCAIL
jgi:hypothetical protein